MEITRAQEHLNEATIRGWNLMGFSTYVDPGFGGEGPMVVTAFIWSVPPK